jgi:hypothetical protein
MAKCSKLRGKSVMPGRRPGTEKYGFAGRRQKKSGFFKIFSKNPKVPRQAAVNEYRNGGKPSLARKAGFLKDFSKKPSSSRQSSRY